MKKLFALLLLMPFLFVACDDDEKEEEKPYYNPVEGEWIDIDKYGSIETRLFTNDFNASYTFKRNGVIKGEDFGKYSINKTEIEYQKWTHEYKITIDTLWFWLKGTEPDWTRKYIRKK